MIKNKKGFTLIELIIVMAIIGILAVVAIVAISGKSKDARNARRLADMSAVQTGMSLSCIDTQEADTYVQCTNAGADGAEVALSACSAFLAISFANINDPSGTTVCEDTEPVAGSTRNYSVTVPLTVSDNVNACDFDIFALLELSDEVTDSNDFVHMTELGIARS